MSRPPLLFWRRVCQLAVAGGFLVVPLLNARGIAILAGNLLSLDFFGLTFADPLAVAQTLSAGAPGAKALTGAALVLLVALLLGRVFCSWMCPYGLASEWIVTAAARCRKRSIRTAWAGPAATGRIDFGIRPFAARAILTAAGLAVVLAFAPEPWLNQLSMPGWYTRALQHGIFFNAALHGALFFPALLLLDGFSGRRIWCRYLCPQSVLLAACAAIPFPGLRLRFSRRRCSCAQNDRPCLTACSLALNPRLLTTAQRLECTNCGDCVDACRRKGQALRLSPRD